jgi:hypothetical protein
MGDDHRSVWARDHAADAITGLHHHRIDEISMMVLIFLALGIVAAVVSDNRRPPLGKDGLFGLVLISSLVLPRPPRFYWAGRRFAG